MEKHNGGRPFPRGKFKPPIVRRSGRAGWYKPGGNAIQGFKDGGFLDPVLKKMGNGERAGSPHP